MIQTFGVVYGAEFSVGCVIAKHSSECVERMIVLSVSSSQITTAEITDDLLNKDAPSKKLLYRKRKGEWFLETCLRLVTMDELLKIDGVNDKLIDFVNPKSPEPHTSDCEYFMCGAW